ncbi:hypothetical protein [Antarcticirhabdus aurantiaca]|uniref:Mu transposase C-terminal domain-containing protein n=1 Tax=Antarcticirhabdus aurantiaca TaxID=2606717 RepID=A0ACD4NIM6_9HYPH|nr:Mu transposase C-terminal domain-containing protein [Jeongeuplla avenae]
MNVRTGERVRINGRPYLVSRSTELGRVFVAVDNGNEMSISTSAQRQMIGDGRMTSEAAAQALDRFTQNAMQTDWSAFSEVEQMKARRRQPYVKAVDDLDFRVRDKAEHRKEAIAQAHATSPIPLSKMPSLFSVNRWWKKWLASGRDIRALVPGDAAKGNRTPRLPKWVHEEIERAIDEAYACDPPGSIAAAQERARDLVLLRASREGLPLPVGAKEIIGKHVVKRAIAKRSRYELDVVRYGRRQADRNAAMVGAGPSAERYFQEVEIDHSVLDLLVVDEDGIVLGTPYITILIDRYTRMILGFSLSFVPPSWVSVMDALQMAVLPKEPVIDRICRGRERPEKDWPVVGVPATLFVDRGAEFRSVSMQGCEQALGMTVVDLPPGGPEKKGKVERSFGIFNKKVFHRTPGTKFASVAQRKKNNHDAEGQACLTLGHVRWCILHHIVDVYNQEKHPRTGQKPIDRWNASVDAHGPLPGPDPETIGQYVGVTPVRKLTREGIRYETLRWNSNALQALRDRQGNGDVVVRIDNNDLSVAWALDETSGRWIPGDLVSGDGVDGMSLDEFKQGRKARRAAESFDADDELSKARARERIRGSIDEVRKAPDKRKAPRPFRKDGRKAAEHVRPDRFDPEASALPMADHDMDVAPDLATQDARGPWRETVLPPLAAARQHVPAVRPPKIDDDEANAASVETPEPSPALPSRPPLAQPFTITRRK